MTPNDNIPEENKPLPAEILKEIRRESFLSFPDIGQGPFRIGYQDGATAWAGWKVRFDELKIVLQEFVSKHEAGLLPNRFVYEKAIKILNDGK